MKKYDILIFSSLPKNSGCFLRAKYFAEGLQHNGVNVKFITPIYSLPFMLDFPVSFFINLFYVFRYRFNFGFAIKPYPNTLLPLLLKKILTSIKTGVDIDDIDFGYREGFINSISRFIQKPFPKFFNIVTYHNEKLVDYIVNEFNVSKNKLYKLKQGVDLNIFNPKNINKKLKTELIKKFNLSKKTKFIGYSAHLNIASDLDIILENINKILDKNNYFLIIAGGGPMLNAFKNIAKKNNIKKIYFTGYIPPEKIVQYLLISDVLIAFYKDKEVNYYRSYMKIREYLALKKMVICNSVGELKLFKKYTYQTKNEIKEFINKIDTILKKNYTDKREVEGYNLIVKEYNWDSIAKKFTSNLNV